MLLPELHQLYRHDRRRLLSALNGMTLFTEIALSAIGEAYVEEKQSIIERQQQSLRQLSNPVLRVRPQLLIAPLIGKLDAQRATQLRDELLAAIRRERAHAVVVDVTGVPQIDLAAAASLKRTIEAARLLGARVILCGISRATAATLAEAGVGGPELATAGDLQAGIEMSTALSG